MTSTRSFARSQDLLASVATSDARHLLQRRRNSLRRRRTLAALGAGAALALVLAIIQSSSMWLYVAIGFDVALAAYVTLLLSSQQASPHRATVVALPTADEPRYEYENASVRIVAG
jgi:uncharacterized membrane protein